MSTRITFEKSNDTICLEKISIGSTFCTELDAYSDPVNCFIKTD